MKTSRALLLAALALPAFAALTGCSVFDELAHKQRSIQFDDAASAGADWGRDAPWLPGDATDIRIVESTTADDAVLLADSASGLDRALCSAVARQSAPAYEIEGAPDAYSATDIMVCGEWAIIPSESGWYAWTPTAPGERPGPLD